MEQLILDRIDVINEAMYYNEIETLESLVDYYDKQMTMEMCRNQDINCMSYLMMVQEVGETSPNTQPEPQPQKEEPKPEPKPEPQQTSEQPPAGSNPNPNPNQPPAPQPNSSSQPEPQQTSEQPPQQKPNQDVKENPNQDVAKKEEPNAQNKENQNQNEPNIPKTNFEKIMSTIGDFFKNIIDGLKAFFNKVFSNQRVAQVQQNIVFVQNVKNECPDWDVPFEKLQNLITSGKLQGETPPAGQTTGESYIDNLGVDYTSYINEFYEEHEYVPYCEFAKNHNYTYQEAYTFNSVVDAIQYLIQGTLEVQFRNLEWLKNLSPFTNAYNAADLVRDLNNKDGQSGYGYDKTGDAKDDNKRIKNENLRDIHANVNNVMGKARTTITDQGVAQSYWNVMLGALDRLEVSDEGLDGTSALDVVKSVYDPAAQTLFGLPLPETLKYLMTNGKVQNIANGVGVVADKAKEVITFGGGVDDATLTTGLNDLGFIPGPIKNLAPKLGVHGTVVWIIIDLFKKTHDRINSSDNLDDNWVDATFSVVNGACENFFGVGENIGKSLTDAVENAEKVNQTRERIDYTREKIDNMVENKYNGGVFDENEYNKYMEQLAELCKELDDGLKKVDDFFTEKKRTDGDAHMTLMEIFNAKGDTVPKQQKALERLIKCINLIDQKSQGFFKQISNAVRTGDSRTSGPEEADPNSRQNGGLGTRKDVKTEKYGVNQSGQDVMINKTYEREWSSGTKALLTVTKKISWITDCLKGLSNLVADVSGFLRGIFTAIQTWHNQNMQDLRDAKLDGNVYGNRNYNSTYDSDLGEYYGKKAGIAGTSRAKEVFKNAMKENVDNSAVASGVRNLATTSLDDVDPRHFNYTDSPQYT